MVKIRLTRTGRHKDPSYRIVVADSRSARDGRIIDQIGTFDPLLKDNQVKLDEVKALEWLKKGAKPSDTVKSILSNAGVMAKFAKGE